MSEIKNRGSLPEEVQKIFLPFLEKFIDAGKEQITSVFIYGSATGKNFIPRVSDVNSVVVVREISAGLIEGFLKKMFSVRSKRIRAPVVLTEEHIRLSLDVFPIEFLEMKDNYTVLYGNDLLKDIVVQDSHARLFCEQQIKGKLIRIRQAFLESRGKKALIEVLLKESLNTLIPVFRTILKIKQVQPSSSKGEVLGQLAEAFGIKTAAMDLIWKDKKNDKRISGRDVHEVFGQYIQELETLAGCVDRL